MKIIEFSIVVYPDGDDYVPTVTADVEYALIGALMTMQSDGLIRDFDVETLT